ncbi:MAG: V-type ATP synthase subunit B [Candidatus Lokiarchaeota archaeon]|nr:V-type ATP synthase subunit B [Candidatus Lokiarchaeota archaeon]
MSIVYKSINQIEGPLIFLKNNHKVVNGEFIRIKLESGEERNGKVIKITEEFIIIQVFQGTDGLALNNSEIEFFGESFSIPISKDMLGKTFNSLGKPIKIGTKETIKTEIIPITKKNINSGQINPFARDFPTEVIQTGISAIDGLNTLIRGQKLPIFTGQGIPHNRLIAQIVSQAKVLTGEPFLIIFCGIGIILDDAMFFMKKFLESGNIHNIINFINLADDPTMERLIIPRVALTTAEYFAYEEDMHVLVIMSDITSYCEALREISLAKGEIPSRKGYPGYLYSDLASIYERTGKIKDKKGTITQVPIISMPNDDITHPIPDTTGYITEGQIVLSRVMNKKGIYPPIDVLSSLSRLMKDTIGKEQTREDHSDVANQLYASYSEYIDVKSLQSIIGEESLTEDQKAILKFGDSFETKFINQNFNENRTFYDTLNTAWEIISILPRRSLIRINPKFIEKFYIG